MSPIIIKKTEHSNANEATIVSTKTYMSLTVWSKTFFIVAGVQNKPCSGAAAQVLQSTSNEALVKYPPALFQEKIKWLNLHNNKEAQHLKIQTRHFRIFEICLFKEQSHTALSNHNY